MLNYQLSMLNECSMGQCANALNIEHCLLNIATQKGVA